MDSQIPVDTWVLVNVGELPITINGWTILGVLLKNITNITFILTRILMTKNVSRIKFQECKKKSRPRFSIHVQHQREVRKQESYPCQCGFTGTLCGTGDNPHSIKAKHLQEPFVCNFRKLDNSIHYLRHYAIATHKFNLCGT